MKEVKFKNKKKGKLNFLFATGGAIGGILLGLQLIFNSSSDNYLLVKQIIGVVSIVFWFGMIIWGTRRFINKLQYGLILNSKGIFNNSDGVENVFVPWGTIEKIELLRENKTGKIGVFLKELSTFESLVKSRMERNQIKKNIKTYGAPIIISPDVIEKESKEIMELIASYKKEH